MQNAFQRFPPSIRQLLNSHSIQPHAKLEVNGWLKSVRRQKNVTFAVVSDGSVAKGLQAVFTKDGSAVPHGLTNGAGVKMHGRLVRSQGPGQEMELLVDHAEVLGRCDPETYPIQKQSLSFEYLREHAHLRTRVDRLGEMLRARHVLARSIHQYFESEGFTHVNTPILTSNDCEGAGEAFVVSADQGAIADADPSSSSGNPEHKTHFFRRPAYLTVSAQLHLEALAASHVRVYTLAPCFRAERSQTSRHLAEFWMLEAEWLYHANHVEDVCIVVEDVVKAAAGALCREEDIAVEALGLKRAWPRITYSEAVRELEAFHYSSTNTTKFDFPPKWGNPLQSEHERWLANALGGPGPIFVTDYPAALKPFYMRRNDAEKCDGSTTVACFDLLVPGVGELAGGSLREERLALLDEAIAHQELQIDDYEWYRDLRRFGGVRHGGFGLGFERLIGWILGLDNVRECIPMPRWSGKMLL